MKITLVGAGMIPIPPPDYGAVEKHIWNLARALEARGHEARIVNRVFGPDSKDEYRFALWARKEAKRAACDVLHLHTPGVATVFHAFGPRRFVYTTHSRHWSTMNGLGERIGHTLERRAVDHAAETIAVSRFVAEQIERPTHVVPNGVDVDTYAPRHDARTGRRLVGVGEVAEHKQWHVAADAARGLDAELRIAGPIRDLAYAKRLEDAGAHLLGPLGESDLATLLGEGDVLVHPSISESFGMAVVEGMSAGLPVVCSDFLSFLVDEDKHGLFIPTRAGHEARVKAMRAALERLLEDAALRERLGRAGRAHAIAEYSWARVAERVEAVYRQTL